MHDVAWKLVNNCMTEYCPTWSVAIQNKKLSAQGAMFFWASFMKSMVVVGKSKFKSLSDVKFQSFMFPCFSLIQPSHHRRCKWRDRHHWCDGSTLATMDGRLPIRIQQWYPPCGQWRHGLHLQPYYPRCRLRWQAAFCVAATDYSEPCLPQDFHCGGCHAKPGWGCERVQATLTALETCFSLFWALPDLLAHANTEKYHPISLPIRQGQRSKLRTPTMMMTKSRVPMQAAPHRECLCQVDCMGWAIQWYVCGIYSI